MNPIRRFQRPASNTNRLFEPSDAALQARAEKLLEEMVNIDSTTPDSLGVNRVQEVVTRELEAMGFETKFYPNTETASGDLLIAQLAGEREDYITFVSHADTVLDGNAVGAYRRLPDDLHARGSGVIDNKGGLVVALVGLRAYLESIRARGSSPRFSLRFVCSPNEEAGSIGFQDHFRSCAEDSMAVLGFEPALDNGAIINSRRGNRWYQVSIAGQEAHAGRCKGEQINAAHDAAFKISKLHRLNQIKAGIAVNVGQIQGGRDRFNVVCGSVSLKIDARFPSFAARDRLHRQIEEILLYSEIRSPITGGGSKTSYEIADDCPPFSSTAESRALLKYYLRLAEKIEGRPITAEMAGGAGDVNYMSRKGVMVLDGLGPAGGHMHTTEEFVYLPSLSTRSSALASFLEEAERTLGRRSLRERFKNRLAERD